jgi:hypothetical protein
VLDNKLKDLVAALDKVALTHAKESMEEEEDDKTTVFSDTDVPTLEYLDTGSKQDLEDIVHEHSADSSKQGLRPLKNVKKGDTLECLRWAGGKKLKYLLGGLHWVPVVVEELPNTVDVPGRKSQGYLVRFPARVSFKKKREEVKVETYTEWVHERFLRKLYNPKALPPYVINDIVEYVNPSNMVPTVVDLNSHFIVHFQI